MRLFFRRFRFHRSVSSIGFIDVHIPFEGVMTPRSARSPESESGPSPPQHTLEVQFDYILTD